MANLRNIVAERLAQEIRKGFWEPGARLPGERPLAVRFEASRPVVREALRMLEDAGLVRVQAGRGAFVLDPSVGEGEASLGQAEALSAGISNLALSDLAEARILVEGRIIELAAQRATESDIDALRMFNAMMERAISNPTAFKQADLFFHRQLARASGSPIYVVWLEIILRGVDEERNDVTRLAVRHREDILASHKTMVAAVADGDPVRARRLMIAHIEEFVRNVECNTALGLLPQRGGQAPASADRR
ncbi:hypothetical protein DLJ53_29715 [Acuticoccus sediminis]|uniref:HTH gntR-type domain-containing protein n=1 Tax=Acuticoccus sediminis TaxID=2184697 RepID=A0A8B2NM98_9HYPH|nr:FadR/GntR family transcriptional regulator [Acuticoccus sediminis]RAH97376.1 hypothetical protein DLJ53_29715 [Acuticoccus sediminis]